MKFEDLDMKVFSDYVLERKVIELGSVDMIQNIIEEVCTVGDLKKYLNKFDDSCYINIQTDYDYTNISIIEKRPETDQEYQQRLLSQYNSQKALYEKKLLKDNKKKEERRQLFLKLKEEFKDE
jgi:hypothetical protein